MGTVIKPFFAALRFLTLAPVPVSWAGGERELSRGPYFFPVVGLLLGGVVAAACSGLDQVLPPLAGSAILVCLLIAAPGGLHVDGLADTADGMLSSRPRDQILTIMRDSHIGAMGVAAVVCVIVVKTALFAAIAPEGARWKMALLMPLAGRCAMVVILALFPYARPDGGLATVFTRRGARRWLLPVWGSLVLLVAGWLLAGTGGLVAAGASLVVGLAVSFYFRHRIGGYTGDTLGATNELVECVPALVGALWTWN